MVCSVGGVIYSLCCFISIEKIPLILFYQHNHIIYKLKKQKNVVNYPFFVVKLLADLKITKIPAYAAGIFQSCYSITHP